MNGTNEGVHTLELKSFIYWIYLKDNCENFRVYVFV
jgi:hypothetical protein